MSSQKGLPITKIKITIAKILYFFTTLFFGKKKRVIKRGGINFEVDLAEGIDLSLFLFGNFQKHVTQNKLLKIVNPQPVIFDIGANFGIMTLNFAMAWPDAKIFSFEPTHYALSRFKRNLELNPEMSKRIQVFNTFISEKSDANPNITAFSSWKVDNSQEDGKHPVHWGTAKSTEGVPSITLDDFCARELIQRIDFIKIDTDGHEFEILKGGNASIAKFRPTIIFEIGQYVMQEKGIDFNFYANYFGEKKYKLLNSANGDEITLANYKSIIPALGTIDILAIPN